MAGKPHTCRICSRQFARLEHLRRHTRTHSNEKPFRCHCGKDFSRKDLLKRHERLGRHVDMSLPTPASTPSDEVFAAQDDIVVPDATPIRSNNLLQGQSHTLDMVDPNIPTDLDVPFQPLPPLDLFQSDVFHDFDSFVSTMGLNMPFEAGLFACRPGHEATPAPHGREDMLMLHRHPNAPRMHQSYQFQDAAAGAEQMEFADADADELKELRPMPCPWGFSTTQRGELQTIVSTFFDGTINAEIPSRLALGRYVAAYFDECYNHLPMIHAATFRPQEICVVSPELVLAITSFGAMVKYETRSASRLWTLAKDIVLKQWHRKRENPSTSPMEKLHCVQAAVLLTDFAVLTRPSNAMQVSSALRDILEGFARYNGDFTAFNLTHESDWQSWILAEGHRRTVCCIFSVLNICSVAFGLPPSLLAGELDIQLPSSTAEWTAHTEPSWAQIRTNSSAPLFMQEALAALVTVSSQQHLHSPLANLVLMYALHQRSYLARQMHFGNSQGPLKDADVKEMQMSLRRWTSAWQQARESVLDPRNPDGSNSFTSTSYLGLAYIRLLTNYTSTRSLMSGDPEKVAQDLRAAPSPPRIPEQAPALLHATQALYIPVKLGLDWVSRSQFLHWALSVFLCHLEAAVFLSKWLLCVANTVEQKPLADCESNIMKTLRRIVEDTEESLDPFEVETSFPITPVTGVTETATLAQSLAVRVLQVWARLFRHHNSPWPTVDLVGQSLNAYARMLRVDVVQLN